MDSLKKPEMLLGVSNTAIIAVLAFKFNSQLNELTEKVNKLEQILGFIVPEMKKMQGGSQQAAEVIRRLGDEIKQTQAAASKDYTDLKDYLGVVTEELESNGEYNFTARKDRPFRPKAAVKQEMPKKMSHAELLRAARTSPPDSTT